MINISMLQDELQNFVSGASDVQGAALSSYAKLNIHPFFLLALLNTEFRIQEYIINFAQALSKSRWFSACIGTTKSNG